MRRYRSELSSMPKDELVDLVLELEDRIDDLEAEADAKPDEEIVELSLHDRIVEMGYAEGPLHVQRAEYRIRLADAIKRAG